MFTKCIWILTSIVGFLMRPLFPSIIIEQITEPLELGEGPHWDMKNNVLYFVDIFRQNMYCLNPDRKRLTYAHLLGGPVTVVVPVADKPNTFIAGCGTNLVEVLWNPEFNNPNPITRILAMVDIDLPDTRFNDGKVDPQGRFWAGTMGQLKNDTLIDNKGSLYRFNYNCTPEQILYPVSISNGLVWSHNNDTFYYADSPTLKVEAFDFNQITGDISNRRTIFDLKKHDIPGIPDGMTIDEAGNLWVAISEGSRIISINPNSRQLLRTIKFPVTKVNSLAFGGTNLDVLYVTTAKRGLTDRDLQKQFTAGSLFAVYNLGVKGSPMRAVKMN